MLGDKAGTLTLKETSKPIASGIIIYYIEVIQ